MLTKDLPKSAYEATDAKIASLLLPVVTKQMDISIAAKHVAQLIEPGYSPSTWFSHWNAFRRTTRSPFTVEDFKSEPSQTRLSGLRSFAIYGLDFKIDRDDQVKCIEINGADSGMSGFAITRTDARDEIGHPYRADRALNNHLRSYGEKNLALIGTFLTSLGSYSFRLPAINDLSLEMLKISMGFKSSHDVISQIHGGWMIPANIVAMHLHRVETIVNSKTITDQHLKGIRQFKPISYDFTPSNMVNFREREPEARYVVLKPDLGLQGNDLQIVPVEELSQVSVPSGQKFVLEPFIESTPIYCEKTKQAHDGCMRLVVVAERTLSGDLQYRHFGGYWRLCPLPISSYGDINAMRANLHQAAIAQRATSVHVDMIRPIAEKIVSIIEDAGHAKIKNLFP